VRVVTILLLLLSTQAYAQSVYLKYSQWEQMPINLRGMYIAGAFDELSTITSPEDVSTAKHYGDCVAKVGMSLTCARSGPTPHNDAHRSAAR
jgi:hypothetical protein